MHRVIDFGNRLKTYWDSAGNDQQTYLELVRDSALIQSELGGFGVVDWKPHGANYIMHDYQLVVNGLGEIQHWLPQRALFSTVDPAKDYADAIRDALLRFVGVLEQREHRVLADIRNPLILFREGIRALITIPVWIAGSLGLITQDTVGRVRTGAVARVLGGIVATIGFVSAIIGAVTGWRAFLDIIRSWF